MTGYLVGVGSSEIEDSGTYLSHKAKTPSMWGKRLHVHVGGFNLGMMMHPLVGVGTPRGLQQGASPRSSTRC